MKKFFFLLLVAILILPGCRTKNDPASPSGQNGGEKIILEVWNISDPTDTFKAQIEAFQNQNKNVQIAYKKFELQEGEYKKRIIDLMAEGKGPDIFAIENTWIAELQNKISPAPVSFWSPESFERTFFQVASDDLVRENNEGVRQVYGASLFIDTLALYYNKKIFRDQVGEVGKPASTWSELEKQVIRITKQDKSVERFSPAGIALGRAVNIAYAADIFSLLLLQHESSVLSSDGKRVTLNDQKTNNPDVFGAQNALKAYIAFADPDNRLYSWNTFITSLNPREREKEPFGRGKVAMIFGYASDHSEILLKIDQLKAIKDPTVMLPEDIGIAPVPQLFDPAQSSRRDAYARYTPFVVSRTSKNPEMAWKFLQFLSSKESVQSYHDITRKPVSRRDLYEETRLEKDFGIFADQSSYAKSVITPFYEETKEIFDAMIEAAAKKEMTPELSIRKASDSLVCSLKKKQDPTFSENCSFLADEEEYTP
jgi:ABC-type glycerol-3-phosphate transport system substrate-binding protein